MYPPDRGARKRKFTLPEMAVLAEEFYSKKSTLNWVCIHILGLLLLAHPARTQPGFISINCGALEGFVNSVTGISYEADNYISTGTAVNVSTRFGLGPGGISDAYRELKTLRSFPAASTPTKNCYQVPVQPDNQYLVRAVFYYGGYTPSPTPTITFQLALDSTIWTQIVWNSSDTSYFDSEEAIYYTHKTRLSVCLIRTDDSSEPFINSLELRLLPRNTYLYRADVAPASLWLYALTRLDFGHSNTNITRYPDDQYDRLWAPDPTYYTPISAVQGEQFVYDNTTFTPDVPPNKVLQTAITDNTSISFSYGPLDPSIDTVLYVSFLIAEVEALPAGSRRVMDVTGDFLANQVVTVDTSVEPPYFINNIHKFNFLVSDNNNIVDLVVTSNIDSTPGLGPLLNGVEIYSVQDVETGTDAAEVAALDVTETTLGIEAWSGDPCFPVPWPGVKCASNHVTSIDLSNQGVSGTIPDLSALTTLTYLNLSDNEFTGRLPQWIGGLSSLKTLDVSNNKLNGTFPAYYITDIPVFMYSNNVDLQCVRSGKAACPQSTGSNKGTAAAVLAVIVIFLVFPLITTVVLLCCWCYKRKKCQVKMYTPQSPFMSISANQGTKPLHVPSGRGKAPPFTLLTVKEATNNFATKLGEGGFGPVYFGILPNQQQVAVKLMSGKSQQGFSEFSNEIDLLSTVHYTKLVSLVGYCQEGTDLILLYEYMSGGDLRQRLNGPKASEFPLNWRQRLEIALDAAKGLEYLHHGCRPAIFHRDVKSSNILLTEKLEAKVADFGLSKLTTDVEQTHVTTVVKGTLGYLDPEYNTTGMLTEKSDVYSFGVVLLELLSGQPPITRDGPSSTFIVDKVRAAMNTGSLEAVTDLGMRGDYKMEAVWKLAEVAMSCVPISAATRPGMTKVVAELVQVLEIETGGQMDTRYEDRSIANSYSNSTLYNSSTYSPGPRSQSCHVDVAPRAY